MVLCVDRAGLVGEDGAPQHGAFDVGYLRMIPGMVLMAPRNGEELRDMLWTAVHQRGRAGRGALPARQHPRGCAARPRATPAPRSGQSEHCARAATSRSCRSAP